MMLGMGRMEKATALLWWWWRWGRKKTGVFCVEHVLVFFGAVGEGRRQLAEDVARCWFRLVTVVVGAASGKRIVFLVTVDLFLFLRLAVTTITTSSSASASASASAYAYDDVRSRAPPSRALTVQEPIGDIGPIRLVVVVVLVVLFFFFVIVLLYFFMPPLVVALHSFLLSPNDVMLLLSSGGADGFVFVVVAFAAARREAGDVHATHAARELGLGYAAAAPPARMRVLVVVVGGRRGCHGELFEGLGFLPVFVGLDVFRREGEDGGGPAEHLLLGGRVS